MAKILTIYNPGRREFILRDMSYIRWLKISEALARLGHHVDIATNEPRWRRWWNNAPIQMNPNLRRIGLTQINWDDYDVVKTLFHKGFETLLHHGGNDHPLVISKLGSVVDSTDRDGIYFYGKRREQLFAVQEKINASSRYITVLNDSARQLWNTCHGPRDGILIVPGGVDREVPANLPNPYPTKDRIKCIFAGNIYTKGDQPEANQVLIEKLNELGRLLSIQGVRLYFLGPGDVSQLQLKHVTNLGVVSYDESWKYFHHADVGVVLAAGSFMHNNESSKIYHYLRVGLPVVCESGFPNEHVIGEAGLGFVVNNGDLEAMAQQIIAALQINWDRDAAIRYILGHHTWDRRVEIYDRLIKTELNLG